MTNPVLAGNGGAAAGPANPPAERSILPADTKLHTLVLLSLPSLAAVRENPELGEDPRAREVEFRRRFQGGILGYTIPGTTEEERHETFLDAIARADQDAVADRVCDALGHRRYTTPVRNCPPWRDLFVRAQALDRHLPLVERLMIARGDPALTARVLTSLDSFVLFEGLKNPHPLGPENAFSVLDHILTRKLDDAVRRIPHYYILSNLLKYFSAEGHEGGVRAVLELDAALPGDRRINLNNPPAERHFPSGVGAIVSAAANGHEEIVQILRDHFREQQED